ncbi:LiaF transmembrane domain-containing protein [Paenibacillus marinisediminis]
MQRKGNSLAILLIGLGAFILLSKMGFLLGGLMGYLVPIAIIALGYYGVKAGNSFFGWLFIIIGAISLIGKFSWLIGIIIGVGLVVWGVSLLTRKGSNRYYY